MRRTNRENILYDTSCKAVDWIVLDSRTTSRLWSISSFHFVSNCRQCLDGNDQKHVFIIAFYLMHVCQSVLMR
jgi:hypothetical protein